MTPHPTCDDTLIMVRIVPWSETVESLGLSVWCWGSAQCTSVFNLNEEGGLGGSKDLCWNGKAFIVTHLAGSVRSNPNRRAAVP